jgi:uncharacterized membrane protein YcaP (DUF421 family)
MTLEFVFNYVWTPIAVFLVGYILLRIMGKKAVAQMSSFDLLVVLVLGTVISEPVVTKRLGIASYYAVAVAGVYIFFSYLALNNRLKGTLHSKPTVLIQNGKIDEKGLHKVKLTVEELLAELRLKGYTKATDVEMAVMEEIGIVSVIPKADIRPLQPSDLQIVPQPTSMPIPLIIDGEIVEPNLKYLKKDKDWLFQQVKMFNINEGNFGKVTLATFNQQKGSIDVDTGVDSPGEFDLGSYKS